MALFPSSITIQCCQLGRVPVRIDTFQNDLRRPVLVAKRVLSVPCVEFVLAHEIAGNRYFIAGLPFTATAAKREVRFS
jgi:hypothetical protein